LFIAGKEKNFMRHHVQAKNYESRKIKKTHLDYQIEYPIMGIAKSMWKLINGRLPLLDRNA